MLPGNIGIVRDCLEMLHIHVFFVAPLGACDMSQVGANQHEG